jgi:hypothetical protein
MTRNEFFKLTEALEVEMTAGRNAYRATGRAVNLDTVAKSRAAFVAALEPMQRMRAEILTSIPPVDPEMPLSGVEEDEVKRRLADVAVLESGMWTRGIADLRLQPFVGGPGIEALKFWIAKCDEITESETRFQSQTWPAPFRYQPLSGDARRSGAMIFDGRRLRVGEVVNLTRSQYEAWRDKFIPVETEEAVTS